MERLNGHTKKREGQRERDGTKEQTTGKEEKPMSEKCNHSNNKLPMGINIKRYKSVQRDSYSSTKKQNQNQSIIKILLTAHS